MGYIGGGVMLYTKYEDKNSAHCSEAKPGARSHSEKKGKTNSIVVVLLWCCL